MLPPVGPGSGYYISTAYADCAIMCLQEHAEDHPGAPFFQYLAFTVPHFPFQAPAEDITCYAKRYSDGWGVIRKQRWDRRKELGILDSALSARDSKTIPNRTFPKRNCGSKQIGPGEAGHAVPGPTWPGNRRPFRPQRWRSTPRWSTGWTRRSAGS